MPGGGQTGHELGGQRTGPWCILKTAFALDPNFDTRPQPVRDSAQNGTARSGLPYLNYAVAGNGVSISLNRLTSFVAQIICVETAVRG
jgi:hypothetical protein